MDVDRNTLVFIFGLTLFVVYLTILYIREKRVKKDLERKKRSFKILTIQYLAEPHEVLGLVSSSGEDEDVAMLELIAQAESMGGNAILGFSTNVHSDVSGKTETTFALTGGKKVSGSTSTSETFHFNGTAIKIDKKNKLKNEDVNEKEYLDKFKEIDYLLAVGMIDEVEHKSRKSTLAKEFHQKKLDDEENLKLKKIEIERQEE